MSSLLPRPLVRLLAGTALLTAAVAAGQPSEYEIKAVYLYHFTEFVSWPENAFPGPTAPFVIGVVGPDPFGSSLEEVVRHESVGTHPIEIRHVTDPSSELGCRILFVAQGSEGRLRSHPLGTAPILTVGETPAFVQDGGIVEFVTDHNHVRLRIDLGQARAHGLEVSAKLLRVAEVVDASAGNVRIVK